MSQQDINWNSFEIVTACVRIPKRFKLTSRFNLHYSIMGEILGILLVLTQTVLSQMEVRQWLHSQQEEELIRSFYLVKGDTPQTWHNASESCSSIYTNGSLARLQQPHVIGPVMAALEDRLEEGDRAWLGASKYKVIGNGNFYALNSTEYRPITGESLVASQGRSCVWKIGQATRISSYSCFGLIATFTCFFQDECPSSIPQFRVASSPYEDEDCVYALGMLGNGDEVTWYNARNHCLFLGGDLASPEVIPDRFDMLNASWLGGHGRQWVWTEHAGNSQPMTFTRWNNNIVEEADHKNEHHICLVTLKNGWTSDDCTDKHEFYVCEDVTIRRGETTEPLDNATTGPSMLNGGEMLLIIIGASVGGGVVIIIVIVVSVVCCRKALAKKREETGDYSSRDFTFVSAGAGKTNDRHRVNNNNTQNNDITESAAAQNAGFNPYEDVDIGPPPARTDDIMLSSVNKYNRPIPGVVQNNRPTYRYEEAADVMASISKAPDVIAYSTPIDVKYGETSFSSEETPRGNKSPIYSKARPDSVLEEGEVEIVDNATYQSYSMK